MNMQNSSAESFPLPSPTRQSHPFTALIFDLFHTLTSLEVSGAPGGHTAEILGIEPELWNRYWFQDPPDYCLGLVPVDIPIRRLARRLNPLVTESQLRTALRVRHQRFRHALLNIEPETLASLAELRGKGFGLGLISNCGKDEIAHWPESPLAPLFTVAVFSCEVRLKKPDPAIYHLTAAKLGAAPEQCLFIGNGGSDELAGARRAGMTPVLLTRHLEVVRPEHIIKVMPAARHYIRTVADLKPLLGL
jgi:putative hydrolase of the HAD superfamily